MLIKKLYTEDNLKKQTNLFTKGHIFQPFILPSIFLSTSCNFYKSPNDIMVIKVYVDRSDSEFFTGISLNRKLTDFEIIKLKSEIKRVFRTTVFDKKLIYIYDN